MALKLLCCKLIPIFFFIILNSIILAEKRKTLHIQLKRSVSSLNQDFIITKDVRTSNEKITRKVREAPTNEFHRRSARSVDSNMVSLVNLNDSHPQLIVHWAGEGSSVIIALARDITPLANSTSEVFFSYDYGKSFQSKQSLLKDNNGKNATIQQFFCSPVYNSHYLFADVFHKYLFVTTDSGYTFTRYSIPFKADSITFHPTKYQILLATQKDDPDKALWASDDFGESWKPIQYNVESFYWGVPPHDDEMDLYVQRIESEDHSTIIKSNDLFHEYVMNTIITEVEDFEVYEEYMFATKRQHLFGSRETSGTLELLISYNRKPFQKASFPKNLIEEDYYIVDASENQVFVCVNHEGTVSHLYTSDVNGTTFSLSLENIVYFNLNPSISHNIHSHIEDDIFIDLHKVDGLRGIYIANQFKSASHIAIENTVSLITFDKGGEWSYLKPPVIDSIGKNFSCISNSCSLHLAQRFSQLNPSNRNIPILTKKSAVGLVMATGAISTSVKTIENDVFLSTDAGVNWREVLKGNYLFNFGDHGGLIVATYKYGLTDEILYSWDEGQTWERLHFSNNRIHVYGLMTEPGEKTTIFTIFGSLPDGHHWQIIQIDLMSVFQGKSCSEDDYKDWYPGDDKKSFCLMGRRTKYKRRYSNIKCYNGEDYDREISSENCTCKREDFECDYGFKEDPQSNNYTCIPDDISDPPSASQQCSITHLFYVKSRGYRRVAGDTCVGGDDEKYSPLLIPCPVEEKSEFLLFSLKTSIKRYDLATKVIEDFPVGPLESVIAVDYSYKENCLYWADITQDRIARLCLFGNSSVEVLVETDLHSVEGIAYDWLNNNLYWIEAGLPSSIQAISTIVRQKGRLRRTIVNGTHLGKPRAIALNPMEGLIFWTDWNESNPGIMRSQLDGSDIRRIISNVQWPNGITLDFEEHRFYYTDAKLDIIGSANFDGTDNRILLSGTNIPHPYAISLYKDWIFWTDWTEKSITLANKFNGRGMTTILTDLMGIMDLKIMHRSIQAGTGPCFINRCNYLCVSRPGNISNCLCPDGYMIEKVHDGERCSCYSGETLDAKTGLCVTSSTCKDDQLKCPDNVCIPKTWMCDHINNCEDGSDERRCFDNTCSSFETPCNDGSCITKHYWCDGIRDCDDNSDEMNCKPTSCEPNEFHCNNGRCILNKYLCDYDDDCADGSDEENCHHKTEAPIICNSTMFPCDNGDCIPTSQRCNQNDDCGDGSDEINCSYNTCLPYQFHCRNKKCIFVDLLCNSYDDCGDNSDEVNCTTSTEKPTTTTNPSSSCSPNKFFCNNHRCISFDFKCDGIDDCGDKSDELDCDPKQHLSGTCSVNQYLCDNGECVSLNRKCDGEFDCSDGSDERFCTTLTSSTITPPDSCLEFDFDCGPHSSNRCIWRSAVCDGTKDCDNGVDETNCPGTKCDKFLCRMSGECIPNSYVCNNKSDCADKSDEEDCFQFPKPCSPGFFSCGYGLPLCIPSSKRCDKIQDCHHGEDEISCSDYEPLYIADLLADPKSITSKKFTLHWKAAISLYAMSITYIVNMRFLNNTEKNFTTKDLFYTFTGLTPFTDYNVGVHVFGEYLGGNETTLALNRITVRTSCDYPSPPLNVTVRALPTSTNDVIIRWKPPESPNGIITSYTVYSDPPLTSNSEPVIAPLAEKNLTNLNPQLNYTFWVTAWSSNGLGQPQYQSKSSKKVYFELKSSINRSPVNFSANGNETVITLRWHMPPVKVNIIGYRVTYTVNSRKHSVIDTKEKYATITGLSAGTEYYFMVVAYNDMSESHPGTFSYKTKGLPLKPPKNIKALLVNSSTIKVHWDPPNDKRAKWIYEISYGLLRKKMKVVTKTTETSAFVNNLLSCENYLFTVRIIGPLGIVEDKDMITECWTPYDKFGSPKLLTVNHGSQFDSVNISWSAPCDSMPSNDHLSYEITTKDLLHTNFKPDVKQLGPFSNKTMFMELTIFPSTIYSIRVNVLGSKKYIDATYYAPMYPAPIGLFASQQINGSLIISWREPDNFFKMKKFNLSFAVWIAKENKSWSVPQDITKQLTVLINDIEPRLYYVKVCCVDENSFYGDNSTIVEFRPISHSSAIGLTTSSFVGIMVSVVICIIVLITVLIFFVFRHRRLQRSFLSFANSHYDTRSGATTFSTGEGLDEEEDSPMIRGFSDDEPLVVA